MSKNKLYPIFVKFDQFQVLIVGGGKVGLEKITSVLNNSPDTRVTLVGERILPEIRDFAAGFDHTVVEERPFEPQDLEGKHFVLAATDKAALNREIKELASARGILTNVADTPELCDFYLASIVQKGDLKIAISTNGKSPTIAKRLKENFQEALPDELDEVLQNMHDIRSTFIGDFSDKVKALNEITTVLATDGKKTARIGELKWRRIATGALTAFGVLLLANIVFLTGLHQAIETPFLIFFAVGFFAQLVDGLLGMGYGLISAIGLMTFNVNVAAISSSIHTAEMFASGASGYSHYRFGNVNPKLFRTLLIPGILGAVIGAVALSWLDQNDYAQWIRPFLAAYTFLLGVRLISRAFAKAPTKRKKLRHVGWLAGFGGFLDSFGGGGWGPLVTSTLVVRGKTPQYVIGSVSLTEFFITLASAITFFTMIGISHWQVIAGLTLGGVLAAPLAARMAGRLSSQKMFLGVGIIVIVWSLRILARVILE